MSPPRPPSQPGGYALNISAPYDLGAVSKAQVGRCQIGAGTRSPPQGLRSSAAHEIAYVLSGRVRVDTESRSYEAKAGDILTLIPAEPHSTTGLEDSELFFVLLDPL